MQLKKSHKLIIIAYCTLVICTILTAVLTSINYRQLSHKYTELAVDNYILENRLTAIQAEVQIQSDRIYALEESYSLLLENKSEVEEPEEPEIELNLTDITMPSNLDANQFNEIIDSYLSSIGKSESKMYNIGEYLVKIENENNVNGLLCLAIASLESGYGTSGAARNNNNLFGLIGSNGLLKFDSVEDCILYWGSLIRNYYIDCGLETIYAIGSKYCPGSDSWAGNVSYLMEEYAEQVNS